MTGRIKCQALKSRSIRHRSLAAIKKTGSAGTPKIIDPVALPALVTRHISEALRLANLESGPPEQRDAAIRFILFTFLKCSRMMRHLVVDIETPHVLQQLITETYFNCALLQSADKINRKRIKEIAQEMPEFPILQSAGSQLREKARLFLRSIDVGGKLAGGRRSTRWTNTVFMAFAKLITQHLFAILKMIPYSLKHPDAAYRLDKKQLEPAYQHALDFFESIHFDISGQQITVQNWPRLWHIVSTLIVTDRSTPDFSYHAELLHLCSWTDFYENDDLRQGIVARSHRQSEAKLHSHIREKIKKKLEAELGITKLRKARRR